MSFRVLAILSCRWRWPWLSCAVICRAAGCLLSDNEKQLITGCPAGWEAGKTVASFLPWVRNWHSPLVRGSNALTSVINQGYSTQQRHFFYSVSMIFYSLKQLDSGKKNVLCYLAYIHCPLLRHHLKYWMIFSEKWDVSFILNQKQKDGFHNTQHQCKLERKPNFISQSLLTVLTSSLVPHIPNTIRRALSNLTQYHKLK